MINPPKRIKVAREKNAGFSFVFVASPSLSPMRGVVSSSAAIGLIAGPSGAFV